MLCPYIDSVVFMQIDQGNENRHPEARQVRLALRRILQLEFLRYWSRLPKFTR